MPNKKDIIVYCIVTGAVCLGLVVFIATDFTRQPAEAASLYIPSLITGAGPQGGPHVRAFDANGDAEAEPNKLFAYAESFRAGIFVASGDLDKDGIAEIITAPQPGGGPQVRAFEKDGTPLSIDIWPYEQSSRSGVSIAAGDVDNDGKDEIATAPTEGNVANIKVYRYNEARDIVGEWDAFGGAQCGASLAMADVDGDSKDEVVVGAGSGCGPQVQVFETDGTLLHQFFAFDQNYKGGIDVAAGDLDGNGQENDIIVTKKDRSSDLKIINLDADYTTRGSWRAFAAAPVGAFVDAFDINRDGSDEIIVGAGPGGGPQVIAYNANGEQLLNFFAYNRNFRGGTDVVGGAFALGPPTPTPTPIPTPTPTPTPVPDYSVLVGAGDIASCNYDTDESTSEILDNIVGTVFTAGDNAYTTGTAAEFSNCYNPTWGRHKSRTYPSPGNHDYLTANATGYFNYFGSNAGNPANGYYSYDVGDWHIVSLNSNCGDVSCTAGQPQEVWLRADLGATDKQCVLAYMHHPLYSSGSHGDIAAVQDLWTALVDFNTEVVVSGHDHDYERFAPQDANGNGDATGARQFVVGTGGASLYSWGTIKPNSEVRNNTSRGVIQFNLYSNRYSWEFIPISGDSFSDKGSEFCN